MGKQILLVSLMAGIGTLVGCSTLKDIAKVFDDSGDELPAGAFRSTAAIRAQTVPLPVDIAENILSIENGEVITDELPSQKAEVMPTKKRKINQRKIAQQDSRNQYHPLSGRRKLAGLKRRTSSGHQDVHYKVKAGDTLMKIAFAKYGDIFRWRDIYEQNRDLLADYNKIQIGSVLVLNGMEFVVISKNGEPYLIRRGDTLRGISENLYGSNQYWRSLWLNNRQMIRNPNRIYAGFTLYYRPKSEVLARPELRLPTSKKQ